MAPSGPIGSCWACRLVVAAAADPVVAELAARLGLESRVVVVGRCYQKTN